MDAELFRDTVISASSSSQGRVRCPACADDRKKSHLKTLSVDIDGERAVYKCHHCDASGSVPLSNGWSPHIKRVVPVSSNGMHSKPLGDAHYEYLAERGISKETADRCGVVSGIVVIGAIDRRSNCIGFPYENKDGSEAIKWRDRNKNFTQRGSARSLWGIENFTGGDLVICEGELDRLSFEEAGIAATSVPNGAIQPAAVTNGSQRTLPEDSKKFSYLWDAKDLIENADRIILATDNDEPGNALAEEIARRVGKARCWRVPFPDDCKDANDVLVSHGSLRLVECVDDATPWPVSGLRNASEYRSEALSLFNDGFDKGIKSGLTDLDRIFRVLPQTLTVLTGIPGSGKSTFLTWLTVQLASRNGWNVAVLSAETSSQIHILQLASTFLDQPFRGGEKMSEDDMSRGLDWVEKQFVFLDESDTDIDSILDRAHAAVLRNGCRALVVDPYNFITGGFEEGSVQGINRILISLKSFAVQHGIAVFLVAHPIKMWRNQAGQVPTPGGYDVSGSSGFFNVADTGLTLGRVSDGKSLVTCWKARFPWLGQLGEAILDFNEPTGRFSENTFGDDFEDAAFD